MGARAGDAMNTPKTYPGPDATRAEIDAFVRQTGTTDPTGQSEYLEALAGKTIPFEKTPTENSTGIAVCSLCLKPFCKGCGAKGRATGGTP